MRSRPGAALATWVPLLVGLLGAAPRAQEPGALEDYLERARLERTLLHERLAREVAPLLAAVAASEERPGQAGVDALARLGPEATPLLVPHLDPGPEAEPAAHRVADYVARALPRMQPAPVAVDLLALLAGGSPEGKLRAARILGSVPGVPAVRPALRAAFGASSGPLQVASLRSLVALGGPDTGALLAGVLAAEDDELVGVALEALARAADGDAAPGVARLLADPVRAARHAAGLLAYYGALPGLVDEEVVDDLVGLAQGAAPSEVKLAVLAALPDLAPRLASLRRGLAPLTESRDRDLREAAQTALAILGDRGARRDLLRTYDEVIDGNKRWAEAWSRRAAVQRSIRDYDAAIRDYKQALTLSGDNLRCERECSLGLARCYSLRGKLRDAAELLQRAPISLDERRALADDPDFAPLRESRWGAEAFALEESP